ncbi:MAG: oligoendopeptidase F [Acidimicrobiaceae bacterium]|nr:oligoendopeptidase F [Acidimicrobiaceae bacterium]
MTITDQPHAESGDALPRWSVADLYPSLDDRAFTDAMETLDADVSRLVALFDEHGIRQLEPRPPTPADGEAADQVVRAYNDVARLMGELSVATLSVTATDSRDDAARALASRLEQQGSRLAPLLARLAEWVHALGVEPLATHSDEVAEHVGPLARLDERVAHQMPEREEELYAELATTGSSAWRSLQQVVTSQLTAEVTRPDGTTERMPINAVRGLATHTDPAMRKAGYEAELATWPQVSTTVAAALNAIKGEAVIVNRRRTWDDPIDASLYANSVGRPTYDAMQRAVTTSLPDWRRWMRAKARLHGHQGGLPWWDLVAPAPTGDTTLSWDDGIEWVREAFGSYSDELGGLVDRALDERWIDAPPADGKTGGAFCASFRGDRSLVLLNWSGSIDSAQTTAHELGHAYHNVTLAARTPLQRRLPMALAETASIFCETLAIEQRLADTSDPAARLGLLDVSLTGPNQVVVDIASRLQFETELFERRRRGTLGAAELDEMMLRAQADTYGDGLDLDTRHPYMWVLKPHYYGSHFYNWPYTYGLLFGLGLYAAYRDDPERFRQGYDDLLSRAGMDTAEQLGARFGLDVTDEAFWTASLDVLRARMTEYESLVDARS